MARKAACLPKGTRISDYVTLGGLTATGPGDLIDAVLSDTGKQSQRYRQLPARLVIYYVMALVLFAQASYGEVLRCLLEGVRWLHLKGESTALASKSALTKARIRLGVAPLKELYERVARPLAEPGLAGAFYRGLRLVSLDGTTILVPDEPELERRFGRPSSSRGPGAFPQARLLALMESGTHAIFAAAIGRYDTSEVALDPPAARRAAHAPLAPRRPGRAGTLRPVARPPGAAWADGAGQSPGWVRPGHAVVHPHGAGGPAPSPLPRRLFADAALRVPLGSANAWLSGS